MCRRAAPQTPQDLIDKGLYKALAKALYPGVFWPVSCALVAQGLGAHAVGRRHRGAFQTVSAQRAVGELGSASAPSAAAPSSSSSSIAPAAIAPATDLATAIAEHDYNAPENQPRAAVTLEEPPASPEALPAPEVKRRLSRSNSELSELTEGLAAHGGKEGTRDKPGRKSFAKFARQKTGNLGGAGGGRSRGASTDPASEALPGPNDRRLSLRARKAVGEAAHPSVRV